MTLSFSIIAGGEDILTRQNDGDDFDDLNNTLKKDFQNRMNEAEQASKAAAARSQVPKIALDSTRKNQAIDEGASDRIKRNYLQDSTKKEKSSKGKRRTNVVEGDVSHAEEELKELVMDVTGSGGRHTLDDIENAIAAMAGADDTISKKGFK